MENKVVVADVTELKIGTKMEDGTLYAGQSPVTGTNMYIMPHDSYAMNWEDAANFVQIIKNKYGHDGSKTVNANDLNDPSKDDGGWRLPAVKELEHLRENSFDIGMYVVNNKDSWYWSLSEEDKTFAYYQNFSFLGHNGGEDYKICEHSVRYIRTEPRNTL